MISEFVEYVKQAWKNKPNVSSPLNADRLNHMEDGIENNSNKIKEIVPAVNELTENIKILDYTTKNNNIYEYIGGVEGYYPIACIFYDGTNNHPTGFSAENYSYTSFIVWFNQVVGTGVGFKVIWMKHE